jgi:hypothetical protein
MNGNVKKFRLTYTPHGLQSFKIAEKDVKITKNKYQRPNIKFDQPINVLGPWALGFGS